MAYKEGLQSLWKEMSREVQTTVGRRRSSVQERLTGQRRASSSAPVHHGLVLQEDSDSGWDLVERKAPKPEFQVHAHVRVRRASPAVLVAPSAACVLA